MPVKEIEDFVVDLAKKARKEAEDLEKNKEKMKTWEFADKISTSNGKLEILNTIMKFLLGK